MIVYAVFVLLVAVGVWALVDAIIRPPAAFEAAGRRKGLWLVLLIAGLLLGGLLAGVLGAVYLLAVRPGLQAAAPSL